MNKFVKTGLVALASVFILSACGGNSDASNDNTASSDSNGNGLAEVQEIAVSVPASMTTIDTTYTTDKNTFTVAQHLYEGLYRLDENSTPVPGLAAEEVEISEDGRTYTFTIRNDANWSNGDPITAQDFVYAWTELVDPAAAAPNAYLLDAVVNGYEIRTGETDPSELAVEAVSDKVFKVELVEPLPSFLTLISVVWLAPKNEAYVEEQGEAYATTAETGIYSGPFVLSNWKQGDETWTLEPNENYYAADEVHLTKIDFTTIKEEQTGINLYSSDELDLTKVSGQYVAQYQNDESFVSHNDIANQFLDFNKELGTPLANAHLRKAITLSINKDSLVNTVLNDGAVALNGLVPHELYQHPETGEDFREYSGDYNTYNPEQAQEEWALAQEELGDSIEISLLVAEDTTSTRTAEYVQSQIQENLEGVTVTINKQPKNSVNQSRSESNYEASISGWIAGDNNLGYFFNLYEDGSAYNYGGYNNEEYNQLTAEAKTAYANDPDKQFENYQKAEQILLEEDAAQVPLYQSASNYLINPNIKGIEFHRYASYFHFRTAYIAE
ncbi:peptide ABC transporter substrate-binding protein [Desemzia sp. RIT804]|uniref:peptide ABC transporter substrate-binding protein n=1 Tax=Desemzia sp. RIT 804 TaxID=2810209 RepID=UPI001952759B|nr:peptide ABC transporter substrate-binding protein [Desemzia sp. RIT 804]MBM6615506.1 peptide ABC transporter substrate-binding protein [Desemzia sp. RIT 804]